MTAPNKIKILKNLNFFFNFSITVAGCHCAPHPRRHKTHVRQSSSLIMAKELRLSSSRNEYTGPEIRVPEV
jgi:hypothetical protein